jgi:hypothetical protein
MLPKQTSEVQQVRTRISSSLVRVLSKRLAWFSIAMCLLLFAAMVGVVAKNESVDAASAKHAPSSPKHVSSPHRTAQVGRLMPTMDLSTNKLSFTLSLANPQAVKQTMTITNNGSRMLNWQSTLIPADTAWISVPTKGSVKANTAVTVGFRSKPAAGLKVGTYTAQLQLDGEDQHGVIIAHTAQIITLTLNVTL